VIINPRRMLVRGQLAVTCRDLPRLNRLRAVFVAGAVLSTSFAAPIARALDPPLTLLQTVAPVVPTWQQFTFYAAAGSNPIDHFECHVDDADWSTCVSPWSPGLTGGDHSVTVRAVDTDNVADPTPESLAFFVDVDAPIVSLNINEGAAVTTRYFVDLQRSYQDRAGVDEIRISNSPAVDGDGLLAEAWSGYDWQFGNAPGWRLDTFGGNSLPGVHTVYLQAKDQLGNWSMPTSDSIMVDPAIDAPVTIRLAASQDPAPVGGRILLFGVAHAVDGAAIRDGGLQMWIDSTNISAGVGGASVDGGAYVDASGLAAGTYVLKAVYEGSDELDDATALLSFKVGPALSPLGPLARFEVPQPYPQFDHPQPFHMGVTSRFGSVASYACRIDGSAWSPCNSGLDVPVLGTGFHLAEVRGTDAANRVQATPDVFLWMVGQLEGGNVSLQPPLDVIGFADVTFFADSLPGFVAMRVSNSPAMDGNGRLSTGKTWDPPVTTGVMVDWSLIDPDLGGTDLDGYKLIYAQWQRGDGSWTIPVVDIVRLDRVAPELVVKVENGSAFVDEDELLVTAATSEPASVVITSDPEGNLTIGNGTTPANDGLDLIALPAGDVPIGTVVTRHLYVRARDLAGNLSPIVEATVTIDRSSPTSTVPAVLFDVGSQVTASSVDAWVSGKATDSGSGVAKVALQRRIGTTWATLLTTTSSSVSTLRTLPMSSTRAFRSRGTDRLGHVGAWATTASLRPILRGDGSSTISYSGSWSQTSNSSALGDTLHRTYAYGAKATLRFTGRSIGVIAPRGPGFGRFQVWIDGSKIGVVDLRRSSYKARVLVFARSWPTAGAHTVAIRNLDTGGRQIQFDGYVVLP
jgi:hypothetical protein